MGKSSLILAILPVLNSISGGIRGIAELEVLRLIEKELGPRLPIQHFFDLIVGTR
jgi:patatin-like phospholipase/acyl hydrolase